MYSNRLKVHNFVTSVSKGPLARKVKWLCCCSLWHFPDCKRSYNKPLDDRKVLENWCSSIVNVNTTCFLIVISHCFGLFCLMLLRFHFPFDIILKAPMIVLSCMSNLKVFQYTYQSLSFSRYCLKVVSTVYDMSVKLHTQYESLKKSYRLHHLIFCYTNFSETIRNYCVKVINMPSSMLIVIVSQLSQ